MGSSKPSTPSSTTTTTQLPAYAQPYAVELLQRGSALSKEEYKPYTGQRMADMTPEQMLGITMTTNRAINGSPLNAGASAGLLSTMNGDYLNPSNNPGFQQTLDDLSSAYGRGTAAATNASAAMNRNFGGSAHQEMTGVNNRAFADSLNKTAGDIYNAERQNQMAAYSMAPTLANQDYVDANALTAAGDSLRNESQNILDLNYANWLEAQNAPYQSLNTLQSALAGSVGNQGTSTGTASGGGVKTNNFAQVAGTGAQIASAAMKASDIRLKENVQLIGEANGYPLYSFNYIGGREVYTGVMAQDVEQICPEAVEEVNGYKMVNYDMIGVEMTQIN